MAALAAKPSRHPALLCAFLAGLGILATYPVLDMGTNDDWSYVRTSLDLVRTGHLIYNGWATAMLGWQVYWGALFIKLFGFSFLVMRLSTLPLAMGAAYLQFEIFTWFGVNRRNAALGTLTVVLSPIFLPLAASFMTDVPGLFALVLSFYACLRAIDANRIRGAILWLGVATLVSVVGGTARQTVWLGALVLVPSTACVLWRKRGVLASTAALWSGALLAIVACLHWYQHQPYAIPEKFVNEEFRWNLLPAIVQQGRGTFLTLLLMALPVLVAYFAGLSKTSKKLLLSFFVVLTLPLAVRGHGEHALVLAPWLPNIMNEYGVLGWGILENLGVKPLVLQPAIRALISVLVLAAAAACFATLASARKLPIPRGRRSIRGWSVTLTLVAPFVISYLLLLLPRAAFVVTVDRYLIPLSAVLLIPLLCYYQERVQEYASIPSFVTLAIFSLYGVASTHDYFATDRARLQAAEEVRRAGVPRTEIQGGWEYDAWTQLQVAGYINDWRIENPRGAYHKPNPPDLPKECQYWFSPSTPVVTPRYFVVFSPVTCLAPSSFAPVRYRAWLPPFNRQIDIQQRPQS